MRLRCLYSRALPLFAALILSGAASAAIASGEAAVAEKPMMPVPSGAAATTAAQAPVNATAPAVSAAAVPPPAAVPPMPAFVWPKQGFMHYDVYRDGIGFSVGKAEHTWSVDPVGNYRISTMWETTGLAAFFKRIRVYHVSDGQLGAKGFLPKLYHTWRSDKKKEARAEFDWAAGVVRQAGESFTLSTGMLDPVTVFYQLGFLGKPVLPENIQLANGRKLYDYQFSMVGEEALLMPSGNRWRTLHIRAERDDRDTIDLWLAMDQAWLPAKIRLEDREGDAYEQIVTEIRLGKDALAQKTP